LGPTAMRAISDLSSGDSAWPREVTARLIGKVA
jgi:hypothetical protein